MRTYADERIKNFSERKPIFTAVLDCHVKNKKRKEKKKVSQDCHKFLNRSNSRGEKTTHKVLNYANYSIHTNNSKGEKKSSRFKTFFSSFFFFL